MTNQFKLKQTHKTPTETHPENTRTKQQHRYRAFNEYPIKLIKHLT